MKSDESASVKKFSYIYVLPFLVILIGAIMGLVGSGSGGFMFIPFSCLFSFVDLLMGKAKSAPRC
ncbi:hypothetical protein LRS05_16510 [Flavobacterium sp. J372]|uniref:hypothetical protein n=1 Tax=Flavobacterium sp. J372 TaxID=2898436 RepID=UPI0021512321|nr:hypothetical protein [Flavobacterium sp. J372]MCR5863606.1 hypothetical protein [Flavobacterium sp. J372]